jgi:hypothetical protein
MSKKQSKPRAKSPLPQVAANFPDTLARAMPDNAGENCVFEFFLTKSDAV